MSVGRANHMVDDSSVSIVLLVCSFLQTVCLMNWLVLRFISNDNSVSLSQLVDGFLQMTCLLKV